MATSLEEVMANMRCPCGCNMVLEDCACRTAKDLVNQIQQQIASGASREQIVDEFHATYGDVILVTPPKSGLELVVWLLPIIISLVGTIMIYEYSKDKGPFPTSEIKAPIAEIDLDQ
jgi:cytochrome c-type biogenesis protein CcmH